MADNTFDNVLLGGQYIQALNKWFFRETNCSSVIQIKGKPLKCSERTHVAALLRCGWLRNVSGPPTSKWKLQICKQPKKSGWVSLVAVVCRAGNNSERKELGTMDGNRLWESILIRLFSCLLSFWITLITSKSLHKSALQFYYKHFFKCQF